MKKTIISLCFVAVILLVTGCNDNMMMEDQFQSQQTADQSIIPLDSALNSVETLYTQIYGNQSTRSARKVKNISYFGDIQPTRTNSDNPLYYIINYENEEGFAVVGAREGYNGVYAISDSGQLSTSDTTDNPGLAMFFDLLPTTPRPSAGLPNPTDPWGMDTTLITRPFEPSVTVDKSDSVRPILTQAIRYWDQIPPYNNDCKIINGQMAPAGCAPVAIGMLMSAYEIPKSYKGHTYNWKMMKGNWTDFAVKQYGTSRIIADLGSSENLNTEYKLDGSSSKTEKYYKRTFQNFGYNTPPDFQDYSDYYICNTIKTTNKPVLMRGENKYTKTSHAWVCDGYYYERFETTWGPVGQGYLLHMVWGWGKSANGYFKISHTIYHYPGFDLTDEQNSWNEKYLDQIQFIEMKWVGGITPK